jgi:hypothetical protein
VVGPSEYTLYMEQCGVIRGCDLSGFNHRYSLSHCLGEGLGRGCPQRGQGVALGLPGGRFVGPASVVRRRRVGLPDGPREGCKGDANEVQPRAPGGSTTVWGNGGGYIIGDDEVEVVLRANTSGSQIPLPTVYLSLFIPAVGGGAVMDTRALTML